MGYNPVVAKLLSALGQLRKSIDYSGGCLHDGVAGFPREIRRGLDLTTGQDKFPVALFHGPDQRFPEKRHSGIRQESDQSITAGVDTPQLFLRREPFAERRFLDNDIEHQINTLEDKFGFPTDADKSLELSLYQDDEYRRKARLADDGNPEYTGDGPVGWAGWLDARLFARQHLGQGLTVELMEELHRRLKIRVDPGSAGRMTGPNAGGVMIPASPLTEREISILNENPLLTFIPGPFDSGPHGVVLSPMKPGRPGARSIQPVESPMSEEEISRLKQNPFVQYMTLPQRISEHGVITVPSFGGVSGSREFHESLCRWYETKIREPGCNPYRVIGDLEQKLVSGHAWVGDGHKRHARLVRLFLLESLGLPPSASANFGNIILHSPTEWAQSLESGSARYSRWQSTIKDTNGRIDPVIAHDTESRAE